MNNLKSPMNGLETQQGVEGLFLLKGATNQVRSTNAPAADALDKIMMNLPSCHHTGTERLTRRRVGVRFVPSSPVYVHITMRSEDDAHRHESAMRDHSSQEATSLLKPMKIGFYLEAPSARRAKLAADFTNWEKSAVEMTNISGGLWGMVLPLAPGRYSYRFIVDGQWCDGMPSFNGPVNTFGTLVC